MSGLSRSTLLSRVTLAALVVLGACKSAPKKMTMTPDEVIGAMRDLADRGCACETDKECFREVRDDWEATRDGILYNANLLDADHRAQYEAQRQRFGACGDAAGLTVFDHV